MTAKNQTDNTEPKALPNRTFGLIFAGIFMVVCLWPLFNSNGIRMWALIVALGFTLPALIMPDLLGPLNKLWVQFGQIMHKIINPILMGLIFFVTVLPTGLALRILGKDPMRRKFNSDVKTYWIEREEPTVSKESFDNQF